MTPVADLKPTRATWASGDHAAVAETIDAVPRADLLRRVPLSPHHDVLDVEWTNGDAEALPLWGSPAHVRSLIRSEYLVAVGTLPG